MPLTSSQGHTSQGRTIALVGTYPPRQCGIATFGSDLREALMQEYPDLEIIVVASNDAGEEYPYPGEVRAVLREESHDSYEHAAEYLNASAIEVVCLQHELGIFGGPRGSQVLTLLRALRKPVVTTLHTVISEPYPDQLEILREIADVSRRVVVLSEVAAGFLASVYGVAHEKIAVIPHGAPDLPFTDTHHHKLLSGLQGRTVLLTAGLIRPKKGIEHAIAALPTLVVRHPQLLYLIVGATWPSAKKREGEAYRTGLQRLARELGVADHVRFYNEFVSRDQLVELLLAADLYLAPYLSPMQIASGTLAYALAAGKPVVATPFWYAREVLADGRGLLVPFGDAAALATSVDELLTCAPLREAMRERAYAYGRRMLWPSVARQYLQSFACAPESGQA